MVRKLILAAAVATFAAAPVAAAPERTAAPVSGPDQLKGGGMFGIGLFLAAALIFIVLYDDGDDTFPASP